MRFCDWVTVKQNALSILRDKGASAAQVQKVRAMSAAAVAAEVAEGALTSVWPLLGPKARHAIREGYCAGLVGNEIDSAFLESRGIPGTDVAENTLLDLRTVFRCAVELCWFQEQRPFYNVFPVVVGLVQKTQLSFPIRLVRFPDKAMLFRFAASQIPGGYESAIVSTMYDKSLLVIAQKRLATGQVKFQISAIDCRGDNEVTVDQALRNQVKETSSSPLLARLEAGNYSMIASELSFIYKLAVVAAQLASGSDLITPIVLEKDRARHDSAGEEERRWLESRASRVAGRGYDIGRRLQALSEHSPHWRNPHLALFWTGKGRATPSLQLRAGCVVMPRNLSQVPTGYLGQESEAEKEMDATAPAARPPLPARLRFEVLRRDGYRCQLCGLEQKDGVVLHVDHKLAVSNGGATTYDNLWTLCQSCNLGKSNSLLFEEEITS